MSDASRILHLADSHLGADLPARPRTNRPRRGDDFVASYRRVLAPALEGGFDLVIHAGDVFDRPRPNNAAMTAAAEPLLEIAAAGIPVVIVPGNHERSVIPASLLLAHENIHIFDRPRTVTLRLHGVRIAVAGFPCIRRHADQRFADALQQTKWQAAPADVNILVAHQTFESATCGPGNYRFRSGENVVERDAVPAEFDYVAAGHIHRHQALETRNAGGSQIVYAGSPDRISFAEINEPKGFVEALLCGGEVSHRFVEHAVRPMALVPLNVSGLRRKQVLEQALERIAALPPNATAQLRLSGQTTRDALRGLRLAQRARELRPDVLLSAASWAVEFVPHREVNRALTRRLESAFSRLRAPVSNIVRRPTTETKLLPARRGTYALCDAAGRLLYVGKAADMRTRVRSHIRGSTKSRAFGDWTKQIASVEVRIAHSELEALLVEAELIRLLRPPFNRQMRMWSRYCYLCENGRPYGQLEICPDPVRAKRCFGPFRSRALAADILDAVAARFGLAFCPAEDSSNGSARLLPALSAANVCERCYAGVCGGPCAGRVGESEYAERIRLRDELLGGVDDASLVAFEQKVEARVERGEADGITRPLRRRVYVLRAAFDHAAMLRRAALILDGLMLLPGPEGGRIAAVVSRDGLRLEPFRGGASDASRIVRAPRDGCGHEIPKAVMDSLCTAVRELRRGGAYAFVPAQRLAGSVPGDALTVACS